MESIRIFRKGNTTKSVGNFFIKPIGENVDLDFKRSWYKVQLQVKSQKTIDITTC